MPSIRMSCRLTCELSVGEIKAGECQRRGEGEETPMILAKQYELELCIIYSGRSARTSCDINTFVSRRKLVFLFFSFSLLLLALHLTHTVPMIYYYS